MRSTALRGCAAAALAAASLPSAFPVRQAPPGPEPYVVRNVRVERAPDGRRATLLLRDGRIAAVLEPDAPAPPGSRAIDGTDLLALPAFVDAFSRAGNATPAPEADQDVPVDVLEDVRVDMRVANRKGIQPAFRAVEELAIDAGLVDTWGAHGFGAMLTAPGGELLAGDSALATVREAAARDLVVAAAVHAHAAFDASGSGYPSTLMGYHAQLRQFFLDARRHAELVRRYEQGRPGARPAHDAELEAGVALLDGGRLLACEAETARDVERWLGLAEELGLSIAICGGRDAWKAADRLAAERVPVVLTLDWGDEVEDPADEKNKADEKDKAEEDDEDAAWTYVEPFGVRAERRHEWEERRDCALRLHEAGVAFAFGTGGEKPKDLLANVRTAVEAGLPAEAALAALTTRAAEFAGADRHLGRLERGMDATLVLWTGDPLTDEKAEPAWLFVDGFARERELEPQKGGREGGDGPAEGVDVTGTWTLSIEGVGAPESAVLTLAMDSDGGLTGTYVLVMSAGDALETAVDGQVDGHEVTVTGTFVVNDDDVPFQLEGILAGDVIRGSTEAELPWEEEVQRAEFTATREPDRRGGRR
jgi:imidazolonepropionase-like amidohydrolase